MPPEDNEHCSATLPPDVLSNLPENLVDDILIRVPLRDAVRTSILSKKWRCKWCRISALTLDYTVWERTNRSIPLVTRFTDIIYHLLALHVGPLTQFILSDITNLQNQPNIDNLITFLSRNGIQHLVLRFWEDNPYKLPSSFYACSQIRHLSLNCCSFQPPPTFKGFNELVSLELFDVKISSEMLESLISHSLLLEKLALRVSSILDYIQIDAPMLKSFSFTGNIELISLVKVPSLVKLSLNTIKISEAGQPDLAKYFECFSTLEHLYLNNLSVQFLAAGSGDIAAKLSTPLYCLKCLWLSDIILVDLVDLSFALCLIRSSPYLQEIEIEIDDMVFENLISPVADDVVNEIPLSFSDLTFNHLRSVKFEGITGKKPEMELVKLLFAKSPMLVKMLIQPNIEDVYDELKIVIEITKFPRASPKAQVDYISGFDL